MLRVELFARIDRYTRTARTFFNLNRWVSTRIDALGGLFAAGLGAYLVYGVGNDTPSQVGFSLTQAGACCFCHSRLVVDGLTAR
jgi:hypothetical protein